MSGRSGTRFLLVTAGFLFCVLLAVWVVRGLFPRESDRAGVIRPTATDSPAGYRPLVPGDEWPPPPYSPIPAPNGSLEIDGSMLLDSGATAE